MIDYNQHRLRYQVMGIGFLVVVALFLAGTIGMYQKAFTRFVPVSLRTDQAGNQMRVGADVKVRGVVVGEVRSISSRGGYAELRLALLPDQAAMIPANASARLLPKTLFGDRYVSLDIPEHAASTRTLAAGDVIPQDRSQSAMEIEKVLDELMPVLQAVQPQQLATTLDAVSTALDGRGEQLGDTLVELDDYLQDFNPALPKLESVLARIDDVADNYADAVPDLAQAVADLSTTSRTVVQQREALHTMLGTLGGTATDLNRFVELNSPNLIRLAGTSRSTLELFADYSPEYSCMLKQFEAGIDVGDRTFGKGTQFPKLARFTLEFTSSRGKYLPGIDDPASVEHRGPRCYSFVEAPETWPQYTPEGPVQDGSTFPEPPRDRAEVFPWQQPASTSAQWAASDSVANSRSERDLLAALLATPLKVRPQQVPDWSSLLVGPVFRGAEVTVQ